MKSVTHTDSANPDKTHPLPHERDQTTPQQASPIRPEMAQAEADLSSGQQETDVRGEASRKAIGKTTQGDHAPPQTGEEDPLASIADAPARTAAGKPPTA